MDNSVERSVWIAAPRERVWLAITDPAQIVQWFVPGMPGAQMNRDEAGTLNMLLGPMQVGVAVFEGIDPPRQVTSRGLPDKMIATTYTLEEEEDGTRVTIRMSGFDSLPADSRQDRFNLSGAAWEKALENLKAFVAGEPLPFSQAGVAPLFGYWRELNQTVAVERSIWIAAPRERVWNAITDPVKVAQWFSPGSIFKSSGSEVGARLYVENPETGAEMYVQILDVVDPPHKLVSHNAPEPPETSFVTSYTLEEEKGGTRLTLTYTGYEGLSGDDRISNMEQNTFGFGMMLDNLKAAVEGTPLPFPGGF